MPNEPAHNPVTGLSAAPDVCFLCGSVLLLNCSLVVCVTMATYRVTVATNHVALVTLYQPVYKVYMFIHSKSIKEGSL